MSSMRVQKIFEGMPEQIKRLGGYDYDIKAVLRWQGRVAAGTHAGKDACVLDIDSATWADNNRRCIVVAHPATDLSNTAALKTQSHAAGHYIDGSVRFSVYAETPESWTGSQAKFMRQVMHHLVGQLGAPVELFWGNNDAEPTVQGVNGAGADSAGLTSAGTDLPGLWPAPGGV